jgi:hypothetical protein
MEKVLYKFKHTTSPACTFRSSGCQSAISFATCSYGTSTNFGSTTQLEFQKFASAKNYNHHHQFLKEEEEPTKTKRPSFFYFSFLILIFHLSYICTSCFLNPTLFICTLLQHTSSHSFYLAICISMNKHLLAKGEISYYDISLLYSRIHLKWISLCYCAKSWCQNYLRVDLTLKTTPPPIFLDPVYRSGSTTLLYYLKTYLDIIKLLRNLTPFRQHVLLLYLHVFWIASAFAR